MSDEPTFRLNYVKALQDEITRERTRALEAERELAELRERTRWRKYPDEFPVIATVCQVVRPYRDGYSLDVVFPDGSTLSGHAPNFWRPDDSPRPDQLPLPIPPEAENA